MNPDYINPASPVLEVESEIYVVTMKNPRDVSGVAALLNQGIVDPGHVIAVMGQTEEGSLARKEAASALRQLFANRRSRPSDSLKDGIPMLMIGGTAGLMCPHFILFVNKPAAVRGKSGVKHLVLAATSSRVLLPEECGTLVQVAEVARVVETAMRSAGITSPSDVHSVQLKTPAITVDQMRDAARRGQSTCSTDLLKAAAMARGAAALGAAVALGEVSHSQISADSIGRDASLYSSKTFASAGEELDAVQVVIIGNANGAPGHLRAFSGVMEHQLDLHGAHKVFAEAGLTLINGIVNEQDRPKLKVVLAKAGGDAVDHVLGSRHTMRSGLLNEYSGHQAKAVVHALLSGIIGSPLVLANAGTEHQGKPGSNLLCVIASE